jgi:hypothetical protein
MMPQDESNIFYLKILMNNFGSEIFGLKQMRKDLKGFIKKGYKIIELANINTGDFRSVLLAAYFSKILSDSEAIELLCDSNCSIQAEILVRSSLESLFYMAVCFNTDIGYERVLKNNYRALKTIANITKNSPHIFSKDTIEGIQNIYNELKQSMDEDTFDKYSAEQAAKDSNLESFYASAYRIHSEPVHSSLSFLVRYYIQHDDSKILGINLGPNPLRIEDSIFTLNILLLKAISLYKEKFNITLDFDIEEVVIKYNKYAENKYRNANN